VGVGDGECGAADGGEEVAECGFWLHGKDGKLWIGDCGLWKGFPFWGFLIEQFADTEVAGECFQMRVDGLAGWIDCRAFWSA